MGVLIKKGSSCLFIRVPDYKNYNSIEEHIKCINKHGYVWLIKLGRKPNYTFMNQFMDDGGNLILKIITLVFHQKIQIILKSVEQYYQKLTAA